MDKKQMKKLKRALLASANIVHSELNLRVVLTTPSRIASKTVPGIRICHLLGTKGVEHNEQSNLIMLDLTHIRGNEPKAYNTAKAIQSLVSRLNKVL